MIESIPGELQKLSPVPGDILIYYHPLMGSEARRVCDELHKIVEDTCGEGIKVIGLGGKLRLELLTDDSLARLGLQRIPKEPTND